jgi:hypoxanthine phosphoribosyltransferase
MKIRGRSLKLLIDEGSIRKRVRELASEILNDFGNPPELYAVGILKGAFVFTADLIREMNTHVIVDFLWVSSYGQSMETSGKIKILKDVETDLSGKEVLLIDDILDTGLTIKEIHSFLLSKKPAKLKTCVFVEKEGRRLTDFEADFVGFKTPNKFLVGYGLDWGEYGRNLKGIYAVEE